MQIDSPKTVNGDEQDRFASWIDEVP